MTSLRNKGFLALLTLSAALTLTGCKDDKGSAFVGHWYQETDKKHPNDINISYDDGVFHIDENRFYAVGLAKYNLNKLEAKAESDSVLKGDFFSMRLEESKLHYNNEVYSKK